MEQKVGVEQETFFAYILKESVRQNSGLEDLMSRLDRLANKLNSREYPKNFPRENPEKYIEEDSPELTARFSTNVRERSELMEGISIAITHLETII